jgi:hypothetical protein
MAEVRRFVVDPNLLFCPAGSGMCPGLTCTRPLCARPRVGDCPSGQAGPCLMPHPYPPTPFPFEDLVAAWQDASDKVTASMMQKNLQQRDEAVILKEESLDQIESGGWRPDLRFLVGLGLAGTGAYLFWKFGKKRR